MASHAIGVDYLLPPGVDGAKFAHKLAVGQSAGSWNDSELLGGSVAGSRGARLEAHLAQVEDIREDSRGTVATVSFPRHNCEGDLASVLTMIFGKYSMAGPVKVVGLRLPEDVGVQPKFGLAGLRRLLAQPQGPLLMGIFKPALGLNATEHGELLQQVAQAGLPIIKDDEIIGNVPSAPLMERVASAHKVLTALDRPMLYAVNVTGRADQVLLRARVAVDAGATALLVNVLTQGFSVVEALAQDPNIDVPIFAHPALAGAWCGAPHHGFDYDVVLGCLMAHCGADAVLYPAHYGSLPFEAAQEAGIRGALRARGVACVPSAGIHPGVVPQALRDYGPDVVLNAGTGIMDHPQGPGAGVQAFHEAIRRVQEDAWKPASALSPGPLRSALEKWGEP